jgi:hypothetical protein
MKNKIKTFLFGQRVKGTKVNMNPSGKVLSTVKPSTQITFNEWALNIHKMNQNG